MFPRARTWNGKRGLLGPGPARPMSLARRMRLTRPERLDDTSVANESMRPTNRKAPIARPLTDAVCWQ